MSSPSYNFAAMSTYMKGLNVHLAAIRETQEKLQQQMDAMLQWQDEQNDPEYDEDNAEWEDVYAESYWPCGETTEDCIAGGMYYQTYGGGPAGGYVVKDNKIYSVNKDSMWCAAWLFEELKGRLKFHKTSDGIKHVIHIQPKPQVTAASIEAADSST